MDASTPVTEEKKCIETTDLESRATDLIEAHAVHFAPLKGVRLSSDKAETLKFIRNRAETLRAISRVNGARVYKTEADFIRAYDRLCTEMGQPEFDPLYLRHLFDAIEEEGITRGQAAILSIVLGYDPQQLERLVQNSGTPLPFSIADARRQWEEIIVRLNPEAAARLKTASLNRKEIEPNLVRVLDPDHAPPIARDTASFAGVSGGEYGFQLKLREEAGKTLRNFDEATTAGLGGLTEKDNRDRYAGFAATRLLQALASNYLFYLHNIGEEPDDDLGTVLSAAAGRNSAGVAYFSKEEICSLLDTGTVDGRNILPASEWAKRTVGVARMLNCLLDDPGKAEMVPLLKFMTGTRKLKVEPAAAPAAAEAQAAKSDPIKRSAEFLSMVRQQRGAIEAAEEKARDCTPRQAAVIAGELFNELININITVSGREPHTKSNLQIAELLARQALEPKEVAARGAKFSDLVKVIEDVRHAGPLDSSKFNEFGPRALDKIVIRVLLRDIYSSHKPRVMKLMKKSQQYPFFPSLEPSPAGKESAALAASLNGAPHPEAGRVEEGVKSPSHDDPAGEANGFFRERVGERAPLAFRAEKPRTYSK